MDRPQLYDWFYGKLASKNELEATERWNRLLTDLAYDFSNYAPRSDDTTIALRKLKEAAMAMNAAVFSPMPK